MPNAPLTLAGDNPAELQTLLHELNEYFHPEDPASHRAVREMAHAEWALRRARRMVHALAVSGEMPTGAAFTTSTAAQLELRAQQQYDRAMRHWTQLQLAARQQ